MTYKEEFHPKIKSDLKNLDKQVIRKIRDEHLINILNNPYGANSLKSDLSNIYSYHFRENKTDYRISYEVKEDTIIFYYMIAKRENFYQKLQNRLS